MVVVGLLNMVLCCGLVVVYTSRPDALAAVTVFPPWLWLAPGVVLSALHWRQRWPLAAFLVMWVGYGLVTADEAPALLRSCRSRPTVAAPVLRLVSLNCAAGDEAAAAEVTAYRPDVVLLQESPARAAVEKLGARLFGDEAVCLWSADASLLVRGRLVEPVAVPDCAVLARVRLAAGREVALGSLRLTPPLVRADLWNPACWREQRLNREARTAQAREFAAALERLPESLPRLVGGDCNAPAGDRALRCWGPGLRDCFVSAGRGWGDTHLNDFPILRLDQVWASRQFVALSVTAHRTVNSDHRLVLGEVALAD